MKAKAKDLNTTIKLVVGLTGANVVKISEGGYVAAANGGAYAKLYVPGAKEPGKKWIAVDPSVVLPAIGATGDVELSIDKGLVLKSGRARVTLNAVDYPESEEFQFDGGTSFSAKVQKTILETSGCIAISDVHGTQLADNLHIKISGSELLMARFDYYHLAVAKRNISKAPKIQAQIPAGMFEHVSKIAAGSFDFFVDDRVIKFKNDALQYQTPLIKSDKELALSVAEDFIGNLKKGTKAKFVIADLIDVLGKCQSVFDNASGIKLIVADGKIAVSSVSEVGKIKAECPAELDGSSVTCMIHPGLTLDVLQAIKTKKDKQTITMTFGKTMAWTKIKDDDLECVYSFLYTS